MKVADIGPFGWFMLAMEVGYIVGAVCANSKGEHARAAYRMACAVLLEVAVFMM